MKNFNIITKIINEARTKFLKERGVLAFLYLEDE